MLFMELWIGTAIWKVRCHYTAKVTMGKRHDPARPIVGWKTIARYSPLEKTLTNVCQGMYIKMIWQDCSYRWKTENFQMAICSGMDKRTPLSDQADQEIIKKWKRQFKNPDLMGYTDHWTWQLRQYTLFARTEAGHVRYAIKPALESPETWCHLGYILGSVCMQVRNVGGQIEKLHTTGNFFKQNSCVAEEIITEVGKYLKSNVGGSLKWYYREITLSVPHSEIRKATGYWAKYPMDRLRRGDYQDKKKENKRKTIIKIK